MSRGNSVPQIVRFGVFEVDLQRRELRRAGLKIKLRDQSFLVLSALLEKPGELVTRDELRKKLWPADTFVDFDHSLNAAMKRLRDALGDDPENPRFIETVPRRGYRFLGPVDARWSRLREGTVSPSVRAKSLIFRFPMPAVTLLLAILVIFALGAMRHISATRAAVRKLPLRTMHLTTYPGAESESAFSSDGEQVAFVWEQANNKSDLYVKRLGVDPPLRLTRTEGAVCCAAWTSDDRYIAFERCSYPNEGIFLVPSLGGQERRLRDGGGCNGLSWSPKEQLLVFSQKGSPGTPWALSLMSPDDLQPRQLTFPTGEVIGDTSPSFSPDGKTVAFMRIVGEGTPDVYTIPVTGGPARQLTFDKRMVCGIAWSADGKNLIFSSRRDGSQSLWVVPSEGGEPRRLPLGGAEASSPAISRRGNRFSYTQGESHPNLWKIEISNSEAGQHGTATPFLSSATYNNAPQFSPDGKKLVFASLRSGGMELWVCPVTDCSQPQQLTSLKSSSGTPRWSHDGRRISFESRPAGHSQIFIVDAEGGRPFPVTDGTAEDKVSSWSWDGKFVYFSSNRSGALEIWKIPVAGGSPAQVTHHGGFNAFESSDGNFLYYVKEGSAGIWRMPATGGDEVLILPQFLSEQWGAWSLVDKGIYYVDGTGPRPAIEFLAFASRHVSRVAEIESLPPPWDPGFTVSPDGKQIVFSQIDRSSVDLMLVENFADVL
jgi:Tol biopolymer transport system component/DNA-binding winged helix-turn-helix (wHTH) protein